MYSIVLPTTASESTRLIIFQKKNRLFIIMNYILYYNVKTLRKNNFRLKTYEAVFFYACFISKLASITHKLCRLLSQYELLQDRRLTTSRFPNNHGDYQKRPVRTPANKL